MPFLLCFILYLRAISKYKFPGPYIWRGDLTEGFLRYEFVGAYFWRGLFSEFYGILSKRTEKPKRHFEVNCQSQGTGITQKLEIIDVLVPLETLSFEG